MTCSADKSIDRVNIGKFVQPSTLVCSTQTLENVILMFTQVNSLQCLLVEDASS